MKKLPYFYLLMTAIACMIILRAQKQKPNETIVYQNIGKIGVDTPKLYNVSLTEQEWSKHLYGLEIIKEQLKKSDLSAKSVSYMTDSIIIKFQTEALTQIRSQIPQPKADTAKRKGGVK